MKMVQGVVMAVWIGRVLAMSLQGQLKKLDLILWNTEHFQSQEKQTTINYNWLQEALIWCSKLLIGPQVGISSLPNISKNSGFILLHSKFHQRWQNFIKDHQQLKKEQAQTNLKDTKTKSIQWTPSPTFNIWHQVQLLTTDTKTNQIECHSSRKMTKNTLTNLSRRTLRPTQS